MILEYSANQVGHYWKHHLNSVLMRNEEPVMIVLPIMSCIDLFYIDIHKYKFQR